MSYPQPFRHEKEFRQLVEAMHQRDMKAVVYFGAQFSELTPEFEGFKEDFVGWGTERPYSYSSYPDNYPGMPTQTVYGPCVRSDWKEFMLAGAARLMDEYDVDGASVVHPTRRRRLADRAYCISNAVLAVTVSEGSSSIGEILRTSQANDYAAGNAPSEATKKTKSKRDRLHLST